jgi:hypothetical protein
MRSWYFFTSSPRRDSAVASTISTILSHRFEAWTAIDAPPVLRRRWSTCQVAALMLFELVAMTSFPISEGIVSRMIIPPITIGRPAVAELPKVFLESFRLPTGSVENFGGLSTTDTKPTMASCAGTMDVRLDVCRHPPTHFD